MNRYTVWTSPNEADIVKAHTAVVGPFKVVFLKFVNDVAQVVKEYDKNVFEKFNPDWKFVENAE